MTVLDCMAARTADLADIGRLITLDPQPSGTIDISDAYTRDPILTGAVHLGMTIARPSTTPVGHMERHHYTAEALVCAAAPIVFVVAPPTPHQPAPAAADLRAVRLEVGEVLVLDRDVWHSPGLDDGTGSPYYWLAEVDEAVATQWVPISGGPVHLRQPLAHPGAEDEADG